MLLPGYRQNREYESNLSEARVQAGLTVRELCKIVDTNHGTYSALNSGTASPVSRDGSVKPIAQRFSDILSMELFDLWPRYFCKISHHVELSVDEVVDNFHHGMLSFDFADPELKLLKQEKADMVNRLLSKLTKKERHVVTMYYLNEMTLDDIGKRYGVTRERIRQILKDGMRRLKYHKHRMKDCKFLFEDLMINK